MISRYPDNFDQLSPEEASKVIEEMNAREAYRRQLDKVSNFLLGDLAVRENNQHTGTERGGNPSQLFHLLSHTLEWLSTKNETASVDLKDGILTINVPEKILEDVKKDRPAELGVVRDALDTHYVSLPNVQEISFKELMDPSWVESQGNLTPELKVYLSYLKKIVALRAEFGIKNSVLDNFSLICQKDKDLVKEKFLAEIGLTEEQLDGCELLDGTFNTHPAFGEEVRKISERERQLTKDLFSEADVRLLKTITIMPSYITILTMRCLSIDYIIKFCLDDYVDNEKYDKVKVKVKVKADVSSDEGAALEDLTLVDCTEK